MFSYVLSKSKRKQYPKPWSVTSTNENPAKKKRAPFRMFIMIISRDVFKKKTEQTWKSFSEMSQLPPWFPPNHPQAFRVLWILSPSPQAFGGSGPATLVFFIFPIFTQTKNHVEKPTHITDTFQKKHPKKNMSSREAIKSQLMAPRNCETFHLVPLQLKKTSLPGDPQTLGSLQWAASPGPCQLDHHNQQ